MIDWNSLTKVFAPRKLAIWAILSFMISIAGPFGTFTGMTWVQRLAYWAALIGLSIPVHSAIRLLVDRQLAAMSFWPRSFLMGVAFAAVFTPIVWVVTKPLADLGMVTLVPFWIMLLVNLLGSSVVRAVHGLWHHELLETPGLVVRPASAAAGAGVNLAPGAPTANGPTKPTARLLQRLDEGKRGAVQHLSVRDHYVVVQTDLGQSTLLMRFADALGELDGTEGMRVHRSHWVARTAVAGIERSGGKLHLRLNNGTLVPVSKPYRSEVEAGADA